MESSSRLAALLIPLCLILSIGPQSVAQNSHEQWNSAGWVDDLHLIRQTLLTKYANLQWLIDERQVDLAALFSDIEARVRASGNDAAARAAFDRLIRKIDDGHVALQWPNRGGQDISNRSTPKDAPSLCAGAGYANKTGTTELISLLPGYTPITTSQIFQAGTIAVDDRRVGVLRIEAFMPQQNLKVCVDAVEKLKISVGMPCDDSCKERIEEHGYARMTTALEEDLRSMQSLGAEALLIDLTNNGGGSEWAEAVARMITGKRLISERLGYVRGSHWQKHWTELAGELRAFAKSAEPSDRARLEAWEAEANRAAEESSKPCSIQSDCSWLGRAGFSTGLVGSASSNEFVGKPWGKLVFSPAEFRYRDALWTKPVIVLVDQGTASAAEEFTAILQDNRAALIVGSRTFSAGCGHTDGGTPTALPRTGATLEVPDCARFRADGSNEVNGILPDVPIPWRSDDGVRFKARLLEVRLISLIRLALSGG